jgi:hypothetical protein
MDYIAGTNLMQLRVKKSYKKFKNTIKNYCFLIFLANIMTTKINNKDEISRFSPLRYQEKNVYGILGGKF